jgi:hypothetical protein
MLTLYIKKLLLDISYEVPVSNWLILASLISYSEISNVR